MQFEIKDFDFYYDDLQALKKINMSIEEKCITALIGPSGCGKSTFLRTLNRMNDMRAGIRMKGQILFKGEEILGDKMALETLRKKIGMVFQKPTPFPCSIFENVIYGPKRHGLKNKNQQRILVEKSLQQAALWDEVKDSIHKSALSLSGGQQQRLCIARCLAMEPEVLLLDEPTSALDPVSTNKVEELLVSLKKKYTIIIVTHSMYQAARISDKIAFFLNGEVVEYDQSHKIFTKAKDVRTERYISGRFG